MARKISDRWRCLTVGCNPILRSQTVAEQHREQTSHRIARWPVRSAEGHRKQCERNRHQWQDRRDDAGLQHNEVLSVDFEAEAERESHKDWGY
ncbi:hypothetical protein ACWFMI_23915 [Nocardiopsis terrae]|uniref:hypothetical protein n=1 Tax=Streptomyces sp. NPDC057554 TaxID=3350538 RepID=UPI00369AEBFE